MNDDNDNDKTFYRVLCTLQCSGTLRYQYNTKSKNNKIPNISYMTIGTYKTVPVETIKHEIAKCCISMKIPLCCIVLL